MLKTQVMVAGGARYNPTWFHCGNISANMVACISALRLPHNQSQRTPLPRGAHLSCSRALGQLELHLNLTSDRRLKGCQNRVSFRLL